MDIVITYVNGLDPKWQQEYQHYTSTPILEKRFRDWGTLRYLFRGIDSMMPFVRRVHLVVAYESQVPEWVNRDTVNVVLHRDFIPAEYLPTFNSNTIEMFLHRIEGLDEEYLYFNDDMFPVGECRKEDFFVEGRGVLGMSRHLIALNMFKHICRNSDRMVRRVLGVATPPWFLRPQHICSPMLKSECSDLFAKAESVIRAPLTRVRCEHNLTQYIYLNYMYLRGKLINRRLSKKHFSVGLASASELRDFLMKPTHTFVCINDVKLYGSRFEELQRAVTGAFEERFPLKSKFENE